MSKRLVIVFCALLALAFAVPAFAAVQNVKVSGDIIARYISRSDFDLAKDANSSADDISVFNSVVRLRVDADLTDNVSTTIRLINERNWDEATVSTTDIDLDLAYVTLKEFLYSPLTLSIGRQELHFGNDMIIGDGVGNPTAAIVSGGIGTNQTTNYTEATGFGGVNGDLAYRKAFDAIRATLNYDPLVIDLVYAKIDANNITTDGRSDDIDLWGINAGYKFEDNWNTFAEGYFWSKNNKTETKAAAISKTDTVHTIGARVSTNPMQKVNLQQEMAYQFGEKVVATGQSRDRSAWASQTIATVTPGWKHDPVIGMAYSYFSGDADLTGTNADKNYHQWDPMFENQMCGHIINALFAASNAHLINTSLTLKPSFVEDVTINGSYCYLLFAKGLSGRVLTLDPNDYTTGYGFKKDAKSLGQEFDLNLTYDYTEDVQIGLLMGWFWPGAAINKTATQHKVTASEVIASIAVKF
ncbi:MAG TPA: hypothetical protein DCL35_02210 [Candidatus Omnitrophica bacterium]|nr:hypothetical protein [Candidatus Omnitrophota bacterium]